MLLLEECSQNQVFLLWVMLRLHSTVIFNLQNISRFNNTVEAAVRW